MKRYTWVPIGKKTPNYTLKFNGLLFKKKGSIRWINPFFYFLLLS
jgi:hypothetical protein